MKRIKLLLMLLALSATSAFSQLQQIKIVSFTVKNQMPAVIDNWMSIPGSMLLVAQKPPSIRLEGVRLVLQIKANGAIVCGNNVATGLPVDNFTTRTFSAGELTGILSGCHDLKEGNYMLCAQFFNIDKVAISEEVCKPFMVEAPKEIDYSPPTLITPDNGKVFTETDMQKPLMFRWTPLVPKPKEPVTYRLRVWQLMQGQNGTQAMRSNQPIVSKDVDNITQAVVTNLYTGPCRPPYLCDFVWNIQAVNHDRKPMGRNNGTSEAWTFSVKENEIRSTFSNAFPEDKKQYTADEAIKPITFRWTALVPKPQEPVTYRMKVWQLMAGQNSTAAMRTNQPIVTKDVDNVTQVTVSGIYTGPCRPPYLCDYVWMVEAQTRNAAGTTPVVIATSEPTIFNVKENEAKSTLTNVFPEDNKQLRPDEASKPITFRWTPVVPKPQEPVTYRLKVWQLMQGQSGSQAMRTNQPIVTKDVDNITQAVVNGIYTGPCRPPYLCEFIWVVEAQIRNAAGTTPVVIATSHATIFNVKENDTKSTITNVFPEDKIQYTPDEALKPITFRWTPLVPKPRESVTYRLKVWQLMEGQNGTSAMRTNQPIVVKDVDNLTQATVSGIYTGPCRPPYLCEYVWMVEAQTRNAAGTTPVVIATSEPTVFNVKESETKSTFVNVFPEDKKQFTTEEAIKPIIFRWTPLVPKPQEPVTYRMKVWQLMQGQNGSSAMRTNQPIVVKDVDNVTQATVSGIYTGPCRPPYLCEYVWMVEAITRNAAGTEPKVIASSEPTMFAVSQYIIQIDSIKVICTDKPGVYSFSYTITNPNAGPATLNVFTVTSSVPAGATIGSFSPPINTVINAGNQLTITGTINAATNLSNICIGAEIKDVGNAFWKASKDTCVDVAPCKCDACDSAKIEVVQKDIKFDANGNINLGTSISIGPKQVKSVTAELVYYEYKPESDDCMLCNKDSQTFGNFGNGTLGNTTGVGAGTHSMLWAFAPPKNMTGGGSASVIITVPPTVKCCDATIRWCIRWVITFADCTVCNKLICYEKKKEGCAKGNPNPNGQK